MSRSNDNDDVEYRHHDELFFQPLTIEQCWSRAYHWVFRKHFDLFLRLGLCASLPVAFLVLLLPSYSYDRMEYGIVEVLLLALSIAVANGPVMVAVAELYAGHDRKRKNHRDDDDDNDDDDDDDSWWWYECYAVFVRQNKKNHNSNASSRKRRILGKTIGGGLLAVAMVSFASVFLYVPGIYLAIRWYFVPCVLFFDETSVRESFRRSYEATSSSPQPQERGSGKMLADRRKGIFGIKLEVFCILFRLFLMELLPMLLVGIVSEIVHSMTHSHVLFGHRTVADFYGFALYTIGTTAHKSLLVPFAIVLKTIMYLNLRITGETLTGDDFRSFLRDKGLELESFSDGGGGNDDNDNDNEPQRSLLTANEGLQLRERVTSAAV